MIGKGNCQRVYSMDCACREMNRYRRDVFVGKRRTDGRHQKPFAGTGSRMLQMAMEQIFGKIGRFESVYSEMDADVQL